jgi:hypothetical protein
MPRAAGFLFFSMIAESTHNSTKGGSLTPFEFCPACGFPDLPAVQPETLHLLVGAEAVAGYLLPDGRLPVHAAGQVWLMPEEAWRRYKALCASSEATRARMLQAA